MKIDATCEGQTCPDGAEGEGGATIGTEDNWCELLISQHVPRGAYIDVDEVKVRTYSSLAISHS